MSKPLSYSAALSGSGDDTSKPSSQPGREQPASSYRKVQKSSLPAPGSRGDGKPQVRYSGSRKASPTHHTSGVREDRPADRRKDVQQAPRNSANPEGDKGAYKAAEYTRDETHKPNTSEHEQSYYIISLALSPTLHNFLTSLRNTYFPKHLNKLEAHIALFRALPGSRLPRIEADLNFICADTTPFPIAPSAPFRMSKGVGVNIGTGAKEAKNLHARLKGRWDGSQSDDAIGQGSNGDAEADSGSSKIRYHARDDLSARENDIQSSTQSQYETAASHRILQRRDYRAANSKTPSWGTASFLSAQDAGGFRPHITVMNKVDDAGVVDWAFKSAEEDLQRFREGQGRERHEVQGLIMWRYEKGYWKRVQRFAFGSPSDQ